MSKIELLVGDGTLYSTDTDVDSVSWQEIVAITENGNVFGQLPDLSDRGIDTTKLYLHELPFGDNQDMQNRFAQLLGQCFREEYPDPNVATRKVAGYPYSSGPSLTWQVQDRVDPVRLQPGNVYAPVISGECLAAVPRVATSTNELLLTVEVDGGFGRIGFIGSTALMKLSSADSLHKVS